MKTFILAAAASAVLLAGCASTSNQQQASNPQPAPAAAPAAPKPVAVPAASSRKLVLRLSGVKASTDAKDWNSFKGEWRATFADHAKAAGVAFAMQEGNAPPAAEAGTLVDVHVNDYRMVGIGSRMFLGVMTGNAYIDAKVTFRDLKDGKVFGAQDYNTTSSAWHGVFAKMTPQQIDAIATGVFGQIKAAKN
jgi:hypothetical protein